MNIKVNLMVGECRMDHVLTIEDHKLEGLSDHEIEAVIEIKIRDWANDLIHIAWEVEGEPGDDAREVEGEPGDDAREVEGEPGDDAREVEEEPGDDA